MSIHIVRKEAKYKISRDVFNVICEKFKGYMDETEYHFERIHSIYFDNNHDGVARHSVSKPTEYKEKLRLRAYEIDGKVSKDVFLELKKKYKGIVYKRRLKITLGSAEKIVRGGGHFNDLLGKSQIAREILFFIQKTDCRPKTLISYDRYSFISKDGNGLRVTFDTNCKSRTTDLGFKQGKTDQVILSDNEFIMEIKTEAMLPLWLTHAMAENKIFPQSFSKYGQVYKRRYA